MERLRLGAVRGAGWRTLALALGLVLGGCGGGGGGGVGSGNPDPAKEVADQLQDEATAEQGVWRLLEELGIGVYTPDGQQKLAGSEQSEDDFWLYDFEVPILASMATRQARPFSVYHGVLKKIGYAGTAEDLRAAYQSVYDAHPDHPLVQVLRATGVDFSSQPELTPLQEWLLLLDTVVPPNGRDAARSAGRRAGKSPCRVEIKGGKVVAGWGLAEEKSAIELQIAYDEYIAVHGKLLADAAMLDMYVDPVPNLIEAWYPSSTFPSSATFSADVKVSYLPKPELTVSCGTLVDLDPIFLVGPLEFVPVEWEVTQDIPWPYTISRQDDMTNDLGRADFEIHLQPEDTKGLGELRQEWFEVTAWLNLRKAYETAGITNPYLLDYAPERVPVRGTVMVRWHEITCDTFTLKYEWTSAMSLEGMLAQKTTVEGEIPVTIDFDYLKQDADGAYPVSGKARIPITGGGFNPSCPDGWTLEGSDEVTVTGRVVPPQTEGGTPLVELTVHHAQSSHVTPEGCAAGWSSSMFEDLLPGFSVPSALEFSETVTLELRDGATVQAQSGMGTGTAAGSYTIGLSCMPPLAP